HGQRRVQTHRSKIQVQLRVEIIRILRTVRRSGERLLDIIAHEEMAVAKFELRVTGHGPAGNHVEFGADETAVVRIDAVTVSGGSGGGSAAWGPAAGLEIVVCGCQPEG